MPRSAVLYAALVFGALGLAAAAQAAEDRYGPRRDTLRLGDRNAPVHGQRLLTWTAKDAELRRRQAAALDPPKAALPPVPAALAAASPVVVRSSPVMAGAPPVAISSGRLAPDGAFQPIRKRWAPPSRPRQSATLLMIRP
jgi:hypothetical protein